MTGELNVLNEEGDLKHIWDADNDDEVTSERKFFQSMRDKGYAAFRVNKLGNKAEVMHEFDPQAEKIIFSPPMKGG